MDRQMNQMIGSDSRGCVLCGHIDSQRDAPGLCNRCALVLKLIHDDWKLLNRMEQYIIGETVEKPHGRLDRRETQSVAK
jgi:hypothetical protein